jgi:DnaJ-class molecular chaperone
MVLIRKAHGMSESKSHAAEAHLVGGKLQGWTGRKCPRCKGHGLIYDESYDNDRACPACAGTGEEYGDVE